MLSAAITVAVLSGSPEHRYGVSTIAGKLFRQAAETKSLALCAIESNPASSIPALPMPGATTFRILPTRSYTEVAGAICYDWGVIHNPPHAMPGSQTNRSIPFRVRAEGLVPYDQALAEQRLLLADHLAGDGIDTLMLLQHPHVYTLGRNSDPGHILIADDVLRQVGASIEHNERGGEVTYHGPGQLVAYPIIFLRSHERSITLLVQRMEVTIIRTLAEYGLHGGTNPGEPGVWVGDRKIASIGMAVRRWVVLHGMALNVSTDLTYFGYINPCGRPGLKVTSMAAELGNAPILDQVASAFAKHFAAVFGRVATHFDEVHDQQT